MVAAPGEHPVDVGGRVLVGVGRGADRPVGPAARPGSPSRGRPRPCPARRPPPARRSGCSGPRCAHRGRRPPSSGRGWRRAEPPGPAPTPRGTGRCRGGRWGGRARRRRCGCGRSPRPPSRQARASAATSAGWRGTFGLRRFEVAPLTAASMISGAERSSVSDSPRVSLHANPRSGCGSLGRPRTRSPTMLRWISDAGVDRGRAGADDHRHPRRGPRRRADVVAADAGGGVATRQRSRLGADHVERELGQRLVVLRPLQLVAATTPAPARSRAASCVDRPHAEVAHDLDLGVAQARRWRTSGSAVRPRSRATSSSRFSSSR